MPFFLNSPTKKDTGTERRNSSEKPSTSSESEVDTVSLASSTEEPQPTDHGSSICTPEHKGSPVKPKKGMGRVVKGWFCNGIGVKKKKEKRNDKRKKEIKLVTVEQIREQIENGKFFEVSQSLIQLEREMSGSSNGECNEKLALDQNALESAYVLLKEEVFSIIRESLTIVPWKPESLRHAVNAIVEQEKEDEKYGLGVPSGNIVSSRPKKWKELWKDTVMESVTARMKDPPFTDTSKDLSAVGRSFLHMGKTMKEDMITVVQDIQQYYPQPFNVCCTYAECYHRYFSSQLETVAQFELGDKDTYLLLNWVQNIYPNQIRNHPILVKELDKAELGSLLPPQDIQQLEATYLVNEVAFVKNCLTRSLEMEVKWWAKEAEPRMLDGCFHSELAIDVTQSIHGGQVQAEDIAPNLAKKMAQQLLPEVFNFLKSYKKELEEFIREKSKQHLYFKAIIIANINNCVHFRTHTEDSLASAKDSDKTTVLATLGEIESCLFDVLLQDLFRQLQPLYKKYTQKRWVSCNDIMGEIIATTDSHISEFKTVKTPSYQAIIEKVHLHLVREYIVRLMKRRVSLKSQELQKNLHKLISSDASALQTFCRENGSKATWLDPVLPKLADIIRLQDLPTIKLEVGTLASKYPDLSKKHLAAILYIKGNLPNSEIKSIMSYLEIRPNTCLTPLFSSVTVS